MTVNEAKKIIAMCHQLESDVKKQTASIKAMVYASLGGVGTARKKRSNNNKSKKIAQIRADFRRK
ncbi:hypothetical protein [Chryseobacterium profundimaris]|uniref:Histone H1 n=1 Tax=Chryseobacterium profundimaris TaxID=1387275 RepID=A0ABY1NTC8_9FLAO|nr:hypothetical protein [Chryseobacterium profundimaris]SMP16422.1 hypothetical protein SAMN06264346_10438 [Chryseobacterium profundimaris]